MSCKSLVLNISWYVWRSISAVSCADVHWWGFQKCAFARACSRFVHSRQPPKITGFSSQWIRLINVSKTFPSKPSCCPCGVANTSYAQKLVKNVRKEEHEKNLYCNAHSSARKAPERSFNIFSRDYIYPASWVPRTWRSHSGYFCRPWGSKLSPLTTFTWPSTVAV